MHNMGNVDVKCLQFFRVLNDVYREGLEKRESNKWLCHKAWSDIL